MTGGGGFGIDDLSIALLLGGVVLLLSVVAVRVSVRSGLPSLLLYLGIGLALGTGGLGIPFDNDLLTQVLGYTALVLILAEGGLTTSWPAIKPSVRPAALLSTLGVVVSVGVTGTATHLLLNLGWEQSFLVGAILSSTDAAAVFSVLRTVPLPRRITGMLEAESGFNDAPVVMLVLALSHAVVSPGPTNWWEVAALAVVELVVGAAVGATLGWLGGRLLSFFADTSSALFSIAVMAVCVIAFAGATLLHTSGFIAVYLAALVLGNMALPHRQAIKGFSAAVGWLAQIGLFVLLGLLATPSELLRWVGPAFLIGLILLLVGRPLSILVSMTPFRVGWRDQVFLSWAGLRGAVPVVLATVPVTSGAAELGWLFDLVFVLVVIFTLVQGPTLPWVARRLGLLDADATRDLTVELTPLDQLEADILTLQIGPDSRMAGVEVFELRLPRGASVTLIVRGDRSFVPERGTVLRHGDQLLVVTPSKRRAQTEQRLRAVSEAGRMAGWTSPPDQRAAQRPAAVVPRGRRPGAGSGVGSGSSGAAGAGGAGAPSDGTGRGGAGGAGATGAGGALAGGGGDGDARERGHRRPPLN